MTRSLTITAMMLAIMGAAASADVLAPPRVEPKPPEPRDDEARKLAAKIKRDIKAQKRLAHRLAHGGRK